jgi:hypothetical protein
MNFIFWGIKVNQIILGATTIYISEVPGAFTNYFAITINIISFDQCYFGPSVVRAPAASI